MRPAPKTVCLLALSLVALGLALLGLGAANAQPAATAPPIEPPWQPHLAEGTAAPDVYLLPDASGKLRQVLGFRYEDFLRAWNQRNSADGPPRFVIDEVRTSGAADDGQVQLRIELRVKSHVDQWIDVPLELPDLIVKRVELDGQAEGECLVYDQKLGGHVAWLLGKTGAVRTIVITGSAKFFTNAGQSALEIALPRAMVSQFKLTVPGTDVEFEAAPGVEITTEVVDGATEAILRGNARPLRAAWREGRRAPSSKTMALESRGKMTVKVGRRRALYSAKLMLDSFGIPVESFRVRLPAGAVLARAKAPPELQMEVIETNDGGETVVEVRPNKPVGTPWILEISAEQSLAEAEGATVCEVGGFEVLGAVRQSGELTLQAEDELQTYFDLSGDIEQVARDESGGDAAPDAALAAFEYANFPWQLTVHMLPQQRRVNIEPRYHLRLGPAEARLELQYDYQFTGARTFAVRVDLRGWQLTDDPLETGGAVEANHIVETEQGLLVLPLVNPDAQRARIALTVCKPLAMGEQTFEFPEALGGFVLPGELVLEPDRSLQVTTDASRLEGVGAAATRRETSGVEGSQEFRTFLSRASLSATLTRRPRQVAFSARTSVNVGETQLAVRQQFDYMVNHRPLGRLELRAPQELPAAISCKVLLDGKEMSVDAQIVETTAEGEPLRRLRISLPRAVQGEFRLILGYDIPYAGAAPGRPVEVALPLAAPAGAASRHDFVVEAKQPWRVALDQTAASEAWTALPAETSAATGATTWHFRGGGAETTLPLVVQMDSLEDLQNAILERAWLQTWVAGAAQQDRAVFQFRTPHAAVHVQLPADRTNQPLEVLLDGEPIEFDPPANRRLSVPLPHVSTRIHHVLELRYQRPVNLLSGLVLRTELPTLVSRPMSAPVYWQLVLPRGWHVAQSPEGMTSEAWLGWKEYRWGRQPTRSQSDLEQWTGASSAPPPATTTSQYLYSAFEVPQTVAVVVSRQIWLVLATTLIAFGVGMLCVYTPIASKFSFWAGMVLALVALVFLNPELTLLAGQAILWGGLMTICVHLLRRTFLRRPAAEFVLSPASSLVGTSSATESWVQNQRLTSGADDQPTVATRMEGSKL